MSTKRREHTRQRARRLAAWEGWTRGPFTGGWASSCSVAATGTTWRDGWWSVCGRRSKGLTIWGSLTRVESSAQVLEETFQFRCQLGLVPGPVDPGVIACFHVLQNSPIPRFLLHHLFCHVAYRIGLLLCLVEVFPGHG